MPITERSLKLSYQNYSSFQTTQKNSEIKEFHKRLLSQLISCQMKVLVKWPEKLFLLDTPFEVARTTKSTFSVEDSSCVSPVVSEKEHKKHPTPAGTILGTLFLCQGVPRHWEQAGVDLSLSSPWSSWFPTLQHGERLKDLHQFPEQSIE